MPDTEIIPFWWLKGYVKGNTLVLVEDREQLQPREGTVKSTIIPNGWKLEKEDYGTIYLRTLW